MIQITKQEYEALRRVVEAAKTVTTLDMLNESGVPSPGIEELDEAIDELRDLKRSKR